MALVGQTEFAQMAGVSQPAIAKAIKKGRVTAVGKMVDTEGPETIGYVRSRNSAPTQKRNHRSAEPEQASSRSEQDFVGSNPDEQRAQMPPKGTIQREELELKAARKMSILIQNNIKMGLYVKRTDVEAGFYQPMETMFQQWLSDVPRTISAQIMNAIKGGCTEQEAEEMVRSLFSSTVKAAKGRIADAIKSLGQV